MDIQQQSALVRRWHARRLILVGLIVVMVLAILLVVLIRNVLLTPGSSLSAGQPDAQHEPIYRETSHKPLSEADSYHYWACELPKDRWATILDSPFEPPFRLPQPGERISLSNDRFLPVPSYLPDNFKWLDVISRQSGRVFPTLASCMEGANGEPTPPYYDLSFVTFLTGGDPSNHLLVLTQIGDSSEVEFPLRFFYILSPSRRIEFTVSHAEGLPMPSLASVGVIVGMVAAPSARSGIAVAIGAPELHEATVRQKQAWWYHGTWNVADEWDDSSTLTNLIWRNDSYIYQLTGEGIVLDELIKVAESLP